MILLNTFISAVEQPRIPIRCPKEKGMLCVLTTAFKNIVIAPVILIHNSSATLWIYDINESPTIFKFNLILAIFIILINCHTKRKEWLTIQSFLSLRGFHTIGTSIHRHENSSSVFKSIVWHKNPLSFYPDLGKILGEVSAFGGAEENWTPVPRRLFNNVYSLDDIKI